MNYRELSQTNQRVRIRNTIHKHGQQLGQSDQVVNKIFNQYANTVLDNRMYGYGNNNEKHGG